MNTNHNLSISLIRLFVVLCESGTTTNTAQVLHLSQSAISHSLKKLRVEFKDDLFVRHGNKMEMTQRAASLYPALKQWLVQLDDIVQPSVFEPHTTKTTYAIACSDFFEQMYGPMLLNQIRQLAPNATLKLVKINANTITEGLIQGLFDIAIGIREIDDSRIKHRKLYQDGFTSCVDANHPILETHKTLDDYLHYPHLLSSINDGRRSVVDNALDKIGRTRRLHGINFSFSNAPYFLAGSDVIWTGPSRYLAFCCLHHPIVSFDTPLSLQSNDVNMYWLRRNHQDPAHKWLRQLVEAVTSEQTKL